MLNKHYRVGTMRAHLEGIKNLIVGKTRQVQMHALRKTHGEYRKMATPKVTYHLKVVDTEDGGYYYFRVEKLIWDHYFSDIDVID